MTIWEKIILDQLHSYPRWKKAVDVQIPAEIRTLEETKRTLSGLKATNLDKMPSGGESQEDRLLDCISQIEFLKRKLHVCEMRCADIERKLSALCPDERRVMDMIITGIRAEALAVEMGYNVRQIYNIRAEALRHLAQMTGAE